MFNKSLGISGKEIDKIDIDPRERTDDVKIKWR